MTICLMPLIENGHFQSLWPNSSFLLQSVKYNIQQYPLGHLKKILPHSKIKPAVSLLRKRPAEALEFTAQKLCSMEVI